MKQASQEPLAATPPLLPAAAPAPETGRGTMRLAIFVLLLSQMLPFTQTDAFVEERYTGRGPGTVYEGHADRGFQKFVVTGREVTGFEAHASAGWIVPLLFVLFFSRLYHRPGWKDKIYWVAIILALFCTQVPPPLGSTGGQAGAIALALMGYSIYKRSQMPKPAAQA